MREKLDVLIGEVQAAETEAQASVQEKKAEAQAALDEAQATIIAGTESTGSPLHDGIIAIYGSTLVSSPEIVKNYEKIAADLKGHAGEPVVLIRRWVTEEGCSGFGRRNQRQPHLNEVFSVGVLDGDELLFDFENERGAACSLPTAKYVTYEPFSRSFQGREPTQKEGMLPLRTAGALWRHGFYDVVAYDLDETISASELPEINQIWHQKGLPAVVVAIGDDGIKDWLNNLDFTENGALGDIRRLCDELEIPKIAPVTDEQKRYLGLLR